MAELAIVILVLGIIMSIVYVGMREGLVLPDKALATKYRTDANMLKHSLAEYERNCPDLGEGQDLLPLTQKNPDCPAFSPLDKQSVLDHWKNPYYIKIDESGQKRICSYGKDRQAGGEDRNADFCLNDEDNWPAWLKH